jgi:zinc protease
MFTHSLFTPAIIEKERKVVLDEVNMINDNPRHYQWILFYKSLFRDHPAKNPVYGNVPVLKKITRTQVMNYFHKWYIPSQITVVVVGDVKDALAAVTKQCQSWKKKSIIVPIIPPVNANVATLKKEKKKLG